MTTVVKLEKTEVSVLARKKFCTDDVYKMMKIGVLPEESGWELINGEIIHRISIGSKHAGTLKKLNKYLMRLTGDDAIISVQDPFTLTNLMNLNRTFRCSNRVKIFIPKAIRYPMMFYY